MQLRQLSLHAVQKADLEANQVVIDAHPVAGVFPVLGLNVLAFERTLVRYQRMPRLHKENYTDRGATCCY